MILLTTYFHIFRNKHSTTQKHTDFNDMSDLSNKLNIISDEL